MGIVMRTHILVLTQENIPKYIQRDISNIVMRNSLWKTINMMFRISWYLIHIVIRSLIHIVMRSLISKHLAWCFEYCDVENPHTQFLWISTRLQNKHWNCHYLKTGVSNSLVELIHKKLDQQMLHYYPFTIFRINITTHRLCTVISSRQPSLSNWKATLDSCGVHGRLLTVPATYCIICHCCQTAELSAPFPVLLLFAAFYGGLLQTA
jgi:hypothetical protein